MSADQQKVKIFYSKARSLRQSLSQMQSATFEENSSLQSLFSESETIEPTASNPNKPANQVDSSSLSSGQFVSSAQTASVSNPSSNQVINSSQDSFIYNNIPHEKTSKLDVSPNDGGIAALPKTKLIALFIAPTLVLILIIIAVWTLYRKGVLTGWIKKTRKGTSNTRSHLLEEQLKNDTTLSSYYGYALKSKSIDSIPELSEWLESVHGSDDEKMLPFPSRDISPSVLPNLTPESELSELSISKPKPVLSTSTDTVKSTLIQKNSIFNLGSFNTSYQNTHILKPQEGNMWKLGALKYSRKKSNALVTPSPSEEKMGGLVRSLWQAPKTPTGTSMDNEGATRSWWSKKSVSSKQDPNIHLDNFHVW
jgi:hypothetical protein